MKHMEYFFIVQCTFPIIMPKMYFNNIKITVKSVAWSLCNISL